jgi:multisubunit Na+/H+ antiporter MnhG subunit
MQEKIRINSFLGLLLLDLVGTILFGLGVVKKFSGLDTLPKSLQFDNYELVLIVFGIFLMLPYVLNMFARARQKSEEKLVK